MANSRPIEKDKGAAFRTRVANGSSLHAERLDGRSTYARRFSEIVTGLSVDRGLSDLNEEERQHIRRSASLCLEAERLEAKQACGAAVDVEALKQLCDAIGRSFERLAACRVRNGD